AGCTKSLAASFTNINDPFRSMVSKAWWTNRRFRLLIRTNCLKRSGAGLSSFRLNIPLLG
ncbi:MAG: hypothetical protein, partial [Olavius algarvensis Delta 4 endosymbiont]